MNSQSSSTNENSFTFNEHLYHSHNNSENISYNSCYNNNNNNIYSSFSPKYNQTRHSGKNVSTFYTSNPIKAKNNSSKTLNYNVKKNIYNNNVMMMFNNNYCSTFNNNNNSNVIYDNNLLTQQTPLSNSFNLMNNNIFNMFYNNNNNINQHYYNMNNNCNNQDQQCVPDHPHKHHSTSSLTSSHMKSKTSSCSIKSLDTPRNIIHIETILRQKDKRTTVMIRNIPNKYTLKSFSQEIEKYFSNKYDVLYLPTDKNNNCNLGFGFINFTDPFHIIHFYNKYYGKTWENFNSDKICELVYAKIQGKQKLLKHIQQNSSLGHPPTSIEHTITSHSLIELPIELLQMFIKLYPYGTYKQNSYDKFIIESFYNF